MKKKDLLPCLLGLLASFGIAYGQAVSPMPATVLSGPGAPSVTCTAALSTPTTISIYLQPSASPGQALWWCDPVTLTWIQRPAAVGVGSFIQSTQSGAMTATTICDTSAICPAGFYHIEIYVNVAATATTGNISAMSLSYTDPTGATTATLTNCTTINLTAQTRCSTGWNFLKTAGTTVTLSTSVVGILGTPSYTVSAVLISLH